MQKVGDQLGSREPVLTNEHLFLRDGHRCAYWGRHRRELRLREWLTRDHLVPRSNGGRDEWLNVLTACSWCTTHVTAPDGGIGRHQGGDVMTT
jgi:5-methylcytosine-specific restriction endonuclease McrA